MSGITPLRQLGLPDLIGSRRAPSGFLEACLNLFDGHPTPAIWDNRRSHWHPAPRVTKEIAYRAHLVGVARAGSYPFRGTGLCSCPPGQHVCAGLGARYLTLDLDDKHGRGDMLGMVRNVVACAACMGLKPVPFTSRSGGGVHVHVFFDEVVDSRVAFDAARVIRREAGAEGRCDVMPSGRHWKGYGTLHALPFNPLDRDRGGGFLLDDRLRRVPESGYALERLLDAHRDRSDSEIVAGVARIPAYAEPEHEPEETAEELVELGAGPDMEVRDIVLIRMMRTSHPQFRWALASPPSAWKGGRSGRDAHLARQMARQGVTPAGIAAFLKRLPDSKAASKTSTGRVYVANLASWKVAAKSEMPKLAGMPQEGPQEPWAGRVSPPRHYADQPNPWWRADVQARLRRPKRSKADGIVLAFLIDWWVWGRGVHPRRMFYLGHREAANHLGLTPKQVRGAYDRLAHEFDDVLRVTRGVPHPTLRLATAFDVVGLQSQDQVTWHEEGWTSAPDDAIIPGDHDDWTNPCIPDGRLGSRPLGLHARPAPDDRDREEGAVALQEAGGRGVGPAPVLVPAGPMALRPSRLPADARGQLAAAPHAAPGREERRPPAAGVDQASGGDRPGGGTPPTGSAAVRPGSREWVEDERDRWDRAGAYSFG